MTITTEQLTAAITQAVAQVLAASPEAPAVEAPVRRNKAGRLVDEHGRFVKESEVTAPKATTSQQASKAKATKAKAPTVTYLRKATRRAFIAAVKAEGGPDLTGTPTKDIARLVVAGEVTEPAGFAVGDGYRELVS